MHALWSAAWDVLCTHGSVRAGLYRVCVCVCVFECDTTEYRKGGRKGKEKRHTKKRGEKKEKGEKEVGKKEANGKKRGWGGGKQPQYLLKVTKNASESELIEMWVCICIAQNMLWGPRSRHHQNCKLLPAVRLRPPVLQAGISKTSFEEAQSWPEYVKELQTSVQSFVSVKASGKSCALTVNWSCLEERPPCLPTARITVLKLHFFTLLTACLRALIRDVSPFSPCWTYLLPSTQLTIAFF